MRMKHMQVEGECFDKLRVLWCCMAYQVLRSVVEEALERTEYPVEAITALKTLCRHPVLAEASRRKKTLLEQLASRAVDMDEEVLNGSPR